MKRLAAVLIASLPAYGSEPPYLPVATCDFGKCVMSEDDYTKFRGFHSFLLMRMGEMQKERAHLERDLDDAMKSNNRNAYCQAKNL